MRRFLHVFLVAMTIFAGQQANAQTPTFFNNNTATPSNSFPWATAAGKGIQNYFPANSFPGSYFGLITTVYYKVTPGITTTYTSLTIKLGSTNNAALTTGAITTTIPLTTVYTAASVTLTSNSSGWLAIPLQTPFLYDPTQALISEVFNCSASGTGMLTCNFTPGGSPTRTYINNSGACTMVYSGQDAITAAFGFDEMPATPCSGTPTAGAISYIPGCPSQVKLTGATLASGINVQWQKKLVCGGTWTDIPGANGYLYTYNLPAQTAPTEYRAYIICNTSGQSDTSGPILVSNVAPCYCASAATSALYHDITQVDLGSLNNSSPCVGGGTTYTSFTSSIPPVNLLRGDTYPISIGVTNCGASAVAQGVAVFIDYNQDGTYALTERVLASTATNTAAAFTVSGMITIPSTALPGITGMRVISAYNVAGTSITGCQSSTYGETEDYYVNIQFAPQVTGTGLVNGQVSFCSGQDATLTASTTGIINPIFLWKKPNNGGFDTSATLILNNLQPTQAGNYYAYVITPNPCAGNAPDTSAARIVNITVNPTPGKPVVAPVITYCQGDPFDSIQIYGENLKWYTVPTGGTAGPYPALNTSQPSTVTYYVSQTVDGCEGPRAQLTLSVAPKPAPPQVTSPIGYCQGVPASPLIAQGQNVRWYSTPTGGVGTPIAPTPSTGAQGTVTWYATQTVAGCESKRAPVVVNVSYLPNGLITLGRDFVCQYDTITIGYFGNALPSADYTWTLPEGAQIVSGTGAGPLVIRFDSFGTQRVRLVVDNAGCIGPEAYYDVPVQISPRLTIDMPDNVCAGEIVNLGITYSTPGIDSFIWDFAGAEMMYGSVPRGPFGLKWQSGGEKTVTVIAIDNTCKSLPSFDQILVRDLPNSNITASRTDICAGDSIEFSVPVEPGGSYQWLPHQFFGESNSNQVWGVVDVAKEIKVNVTSIYNCKSTGSLWVGAQPCCEVYFPTAFTPNGDGKNDVFRMLTVNKDKNAQTKAHTITAFRVVNRWGQTVFETGDETTGWDGSFNGKPADMGTYFFYVKYKCADGNFYEERGEVTLVR